MIYEVTPIVNPVYIEANSEGHAKEIYNGIFGSPEGIQVEEVPESLKGYVIND